MAPREWEYDPDRMAERIRQGVRTNRQRLTAPDRVRMLAQEVSGQSTRTGIKPEDDESIMDKIFSVLGRGEAAIANPFVQAIRTYNRDVEEKGEDPTMNFSGMSEILNPVELVENIWQGLSGKNEVEGEEANFGQFWSEMSNPLNPESRQPGHVQTMAEGGPAGRIGAAVLGLGTGIAADPLTYLTLGVTKAPSVARAITTAGREADRVYRSRAVLRAAKAVGLETQGEFIGKAAKVTPEVENAAKAAGKAAETAHRTTAATEAYHAAKDVALSAKPSLDLKLFGRPIVIGGKQASWEAPMRGIEAVAKMSTEIPYAGAKIQRASDVFNTIFRTGSRIGFGPELNPIKRMMEAQSVAATEEAILQMRRHVNTFNLSAEQKRIVAHSIEDDTWKTLATAEMRQVAEYAKKYLDEIYGHETNEWIMDSARRMDNYVPHYFRRGSDKPSVRDWKGSRRTEVGQQVKAQMAANNKITEPIISTHTLKGAKDKGLNPVEEIDDILALRTQEFQRSMAHKRMSDAFVGEFGLKITPLTKHLIKDLDLANVPNARIKKVLGSDIYFPKEIAEQIGRIEKVWFDDKTADGLMHLFDSVQNNLKFLYTVPNPAHHIRNALGDAFNNMLDGVVNPLIYRKSASVLRAYLKNQKGGAKLVDLAEEAVEAAPKLKVGNVILNHEEIMMYYHAKGAKAGFSRMELGTEGLGSGSNIIEGMRRLSENREDFTRLAHFMDALQKEGQKVSKRGSVTWRVEMDAAAERAAGRVRKFNIDYGDLTEAERRAMKRVVPFYTWLRKNIPLQIEMLAMRPGRSAAAPKFMNAIETMTGQETDGPRIEGLNAMPLWLRQMSSVFLFGEGQGRNGVYWNPAAAFPIFDVSRLIEGSESTPSNIVKNVLSQTSPFIQAPIEIGTDVNLFTGGPSDQALPQYAAKEILWPGYMRRITELTLGEHTPELLGRPGPRDPATQIPNILGGGLQRLRESSVLGELRRQQDPMQEAIEEENENYALQYLTRIYGDKIPQQWKDYYGIGF